MKVRFVKSNPDLVPNTVILKRPRSYFQRNRTGDDGQVSGRADRLYEANFCRNFRPVSRLSRKPYVFGSDAEANLLGQIGRGLRGELRVWDR
jgi:hypothetical protein